jgi:hypothetical protein
MIDAWDARFVYPRADDDRLRFAAIGHGGVGFRT